MKAWVIALHSHALTSWSISRMQMRMSTSFPTGLFYDVTLQNNISDVTIPAGVAKDAPAVRHLRFRIIKCTVLSEALG